MTTSAFIKTKVKIFSLIENNEIKLSSTKILSQESGRNRLESVPVSSTEISINTSQNTGLSQTSQDDFLDIFFEYLKKAEGFVTKPYPDEKGVSVGVGLLVISKFESIYERKYGRKPTHPLRKDKLYVAEAIKEGVEAFIRTYNSYYTKEEIQRMRSSQEIPKDLYLRIGKGIAQKKYIDVVKNYFTDFDVLPISTKLLLVDQSYAAGTGYLKWNPPSASNGLSIRKAVQNIIDIIKSQGNTESTKELKSAYDSLIFTWTKYKIFWKYFHLGARRQQTVWHLLNWNDLNGMKGASAVDAYRLSIAKKSTYDKYIFAYKYVLQNNLLPPAYSAGSRNRYDKVINQAKEFDSLRNRKKSPRARPDLNEVVSLIKS